MDSYEQPEHLQIQLEMAGLGRLGAREVAKMESALRRPGLGRQLSRRGR
jgi:hypothetical protein